MKKIPFIVLVSLVAVTSVQLWVTQDRTSQNKDMQSLEKQGDVPIGGAFTLTDQEGKTRSDGDFRGKIMLVSFGFTRCPDICPVTIATLSKTMEQLQAKASEVAPLFISVDPQRDTPAVIKDYLANFDARIVGLTGTELQIKQVAEAYKIYYARSKVEPTQKSEHSSHHAAGKEDEYNVDHSGYIYMMSKDGQFIRVFPYNASELEIAAAIEAALK